MFEPLSLQYPFHGAFDGLHYSRHDTADVLDPRSRVFPATTSCKMQLFCMRRTIFVELGHPMD